MSVVDHRGLIQYGALGLFMSTVLGLVVWVVHTFVPVWIEHYKVQDRQMQLQTVAMQSLLSTMQDLPIYISNREEELVSRVSLIMAQKRKR